MSKDIAKNYQSYIKTLDEVYNVVRELLLFVGHRNFYVGISTWLEKLMFAVKRQHLKEQESAKEQKSAAEARIKSEPTDAFVEKEEVVPPASTPSEKNVDLRDTAAKEATRCEALLARFNSLSKQSDEANATHVSEIYADLQGLILEIESEKTTASVASIAELDELHANLNTTAQDLYKRLLAARNIDALRKLANFHFPLEDKHVSFALVMGDDKFLSFLLEYGNFNIHKITIGKNNSTAIRYCFDNVAKRGIVACFSVLVKKDISVLLKDADGISIAHSILSDSNHPLRKVLFVDIDRNQFIELYKTLIEELENSVNEDPDNKKGKNPSLMSTISKYQDELGANSILTSSANNTFFKSGQASIAMEMAEKGLDITRLESDPRVAKERGELLRLTENYFSKLSRKEQTHSVLRSKKRMADISAIVKYIPSGLPYDECVRVILTNLIDSKQYVSNCSELHDVEKELKKSFVGNLSKRRKRQMSEQARLVTEIKEHERKYGINGADSFLASADVALTKLSEGICRLQKHILFSSIEKKGESTNDQGGSADNPDESEFDEIELGKQLAKLQHLISQMGHS